MKYGMPSLIEFRTVEEHVRFCAEHGLDFYELNLAFPWFQSDKLDVDELVRLKKQYGIDYTVHFHDEINPFDFAPELRAGALIFHVFSYEWGLCLIIVFSQIFSSGSTLGQSISASHLSGFTNSAMLVRSFWILGSW